VLLLVRQQLSAEVLAEMGWPLMVSLSALNVQGEADQL
jgi:hypothetical protein